MEREVGVNGSYAIGADEFLLASAEDQEMAKAANSSSWYNVKSFFLPEDFKESANYYRDHWNPGLSAFWLILVFGAWIRLNQHKRYEYYLDCLTPFVRLRWMAAYVVTACYFARIIYVQGFGCLTLVMATRNMHLLSLYMTPEGLLEDRPSDSLTLPTTASDEGKSFLRAVTEFDCWYISTTNTLFALLFTCYEMFNYPMPLSFFVIAYPFVICFFAWPHYRNIRRYKYNPFILGKKPNRREQITLST